MTRSTTKTQSSPSHTVETSATSSAQPVQPVQPSRHARVILATQQPRERLLRLLLPLTAGILTVGGAFHAISNTLQPTPLLDWLLTGAVLLLGVLAWIGALAFWRRHTRLAAGIMMAVVGCGFPALMAVRDLLQGLDPLSLLQFMLFGLILAVVGTLGTRRILLAATLALSLLTVVLFLFAPPRLGLESSWASLQIFLLFVTLIFEWLFAAFVLAQFGAYERVLDDLGASLAQSQQLEALKDQFITHVNHELRTPIMTLDGYIEVLHLARARMSEQEQEQALAQASRTGKGLVSLLESILEVRRIDDSAVFDPQIVDVAEVFEMAQTLLDPRAGGLGGRDLHLDIPPGLAVWGDPVRVQQILTNLLSNALKYSPPGSPLVVYAQQVAPSPPPRRLGQWRAPHTPHTSSAGAQVEIRVRDFGKGIPPDQATLLFHRFVRLPRDLASSVPGNGLGLYLCHIFAEAMGGSIQVESSGIADEGSTFILRLPCARPASPLANEYYGRIGQAGYDSPDAPDSPDAATQTSVAAGGAGPALAAMTASGAAHGAYGVERAAQARMIPQGARLYVGQDARPFTAADLYGRRIALDEYRGRRVLLAFLRFAGCPFCGLRTHALTLRYPTLQAAGVEVLVVIESARSHALEQAVLCDAPFPIIADPSGTLYQLYGTVRSQRGLQVALQQRTDEFTEAQRQGFDGLVNLGPAHGDGVLDRLPAEFVIGPDLRIEIAHYGKDIGDFLSLEVVERHLQQVAHRSNP